jgi:hypothetical protein
MCPTSLFVGIAPGPPKREKLCFDVSHPGLKEMHYMTQRLHQMQKHKFDVMYPNAVVESIPVPPVNENSALMFPSAFFVEIALGPPE